MRFNRSLAIVLMLISLALSLHASGLAARRTPAPTPSVSHAVISLSVISADVAARFVKKLYPHVHVIVDRAANALVISATQDDLSAIRQVVAGIDTKSVLSPVTRSIALHRIDASVAASRLHSLYPHAKFAALSSRNLLVTADAADAQQIESILSTADAPRETPTPAIVATPAAVLAIPIYQSAPRDVAREIAGAVRGINVKVAGRSIVLSGNADAVEHAHDLVATLDVPPAGTRFTAVYRIRTVDAKSVASLLQRSFPDVKIVVDEDVNSLSVFATAAEQRRISDGIAQLDDTRAARGSASEAETASQTVTTAPEIYTLRYALPAQGSGPSTSASDLATMLTQALSPQAPDLHVMASPSGTQLLLSGNPYTIKLAKEMLAKLDVPQQEVVLDTEILEVDENTAKNLGLQLSNIAGGAFGIGTLFQEVPPTPSPITGLTPPLGRLQKLGRSAVGFIAVLNLAVQHGNARVLADPRITTLSGHTATIRAGDNISIQLQAGGGVGTVATTQIQTFQTGVTLDITPIVNATGLITVALHPVVNSLTGILNGIPQISTRDTETTVALEKNQTLVIGGLIQDNTQRTESKIPVLGDLPLVGRLFRDETLNGDRNELIITVTPHIVTPGEPVVYPGPPLPAAPTAEPLPTLEPGAVFPQETAAPGPQTTGPPLLNGRATPAPTASPNIPMETPAPTAPPIHPADAFTYKSAGDSPSTIAHINYAQLSPIHLTYGTPFTVVALTSPATTSVSVMYDGVSISIPQTGPGRWQGTLPFTLVENPPAGGKVVLRLVASAANGSHDAVSIPVIVSSR